MKKYRRKMIQVKHSVDLIKSWVSNSGEMIACVNAAGLYWTHATDENPQDFKMQYAYQKCLNDWQCIS